ncbi:hypothetical protein [Arcticibacter sp.]|uniref:pPIWI-associating nuclease domain-containing protein n=1 Tax=Arcticibacter sp. TaxID=1872630 RepID=UPI00388D183B
MNKFTIDFTAAEKKKLWKAKISLRRLEDFSLKQILDAVKPDKVREKEIRKQWFDYGTTGIMSVGLSSLMSKPLFASELLSNTLDITSGIKSVIDAARMNHTIFGSVIQGSIGEITGSNDIIRSMSSNPIRLANLLSSDLDPSTHSVLDTFKPISERLSLITARSAGLRMLQQDASALAMTGLSSLFKVSGGFDSLLTKRSANSLSSSLLQQDIFKGYGISSLAQELSRRSVFEQAHISGIGAALAAATSFTKLAQSNLGAFKWDSIAGMAQSDFLKVSSGYSDLLRSINEKPNWIYDAPETAKLPAQDYYIGSRILKIVTTETENDSEIDALDHEIDADNTDAIKKYLPVIHGDLPDLWEGALQAMHSDNPDRIRHMITSLRELYNHVLHLLAPDDAVEKWDSEKTYYDRGRPTRRGRFLYICRNLEGSNSQFSKLLKAEIDATLAMIELFQGGTHTIRSVFTDYELQFIRIKADTTLRTFLSLEFEINRRQ